MGFESHTNQWPAPARMQQNVDPRDIDFPKPLTPEHLGGLDFGRRPEDSAKPRPSCIHSRKLLEPLTVAPISTHATAQCLSRDGLFLLT